MCSYDRANVGKSDDVPGLRTGESSVKDLHRLLDAAGIKPPYVLVGSSFGGLIADAYAATYPEEVVGMVLINDAAFPGEITLEHYWPKEERLKYQDWGAYEEKLDQYDVYKYALRVADKEPDIPVTYLQASPSTWEGPPGWEAAMQDELDEYVEGFSPGTIKKVRISHYMVPGAPERIAKEVVMEFDMREGQEQGERVAKEVNKLIASVSQVEGDP
jgi:pimeloyl-ACP methyl ester carboxylesterase